MLTGTGFAHRVPEDVRARHRVLVYGPCRLERAGYADMRRHKIYRDFRREVLWAVLRRRKVLVAVLWLRRNVVWAVLRLRRLTRGYTGWLPGDPLPVGALDFTIARNEYGVYCIPRSVARRHVARVLLRSRVWEHQTLELIADTDKGGDIVHAGTYFGDFVPALARSRIDGALVWAFEPNKESYRCASINILLNDLGNVVMTNAGLGADAGMGRLRIAGGASELLEDYTHTGNSEDVRLVSIDGIVGDDRRVGVIHLDVQGHEQQALTGAMETIRRCLPLIIVETVPDRDWFESNLRPLGYELGRQVDGNRIIHRS
jgi:FkbM family methyltransferase